jgi:hypothetical protein
MRIGLKTMKMKIKKMSHLKRRTMIKGDDNDEDKEEDTGSKTATPKSPSSNSTRSPCQLHPW